MLNKEKNILEQIDSVCADLRFSDVLSVPYCERLLHWYYGINTDPIFKEYIIHDILTIVANIVDNNDKYHGNGSCYAFKILTIQLMVFDLETSLLVRDWMRKLRNSIAHHQYSVTPAGISFYNINTISKEKDFQVQMTYKDLHDLHILMCKLILYGYIVTHTDKHNLVRRSYETLILSNMKNEGDGNGETKEEDSVEENGNPCDEFSDIPQKDISTPTPQVDAQTSENCTTPSIQEEKDKN